MQPSDDKKLELLYAHYCDSFAGVQPTIKLRDGFFVGILILLAVMSFQIAIPTESGSVIAEFVRQKLSIHSPISTAFLGSVIWAAFLFCTIRYFQLGIALERQYRYLHKLEDELSPTYGGRAFTREGAFYLKEYPWFSGWVSFLYTWAFPVGLVVATSLKIVSEFRLPHTSPLPLATDTLIYLLLLIATILYLLHIHFKK